MVVRKSFIIIIIVVVVVVIINITNTMILVTLNIKLLQEHFTKIKLNCATLSVRFIDATING